MTNPDEQCPNADAFGDCACNEVWKCTDSTPAERLIDYVRVFGDGVIDQVGGTAVHSRDIDAVVNELKAIKMKIATQCDCPCWDE